MPIIREPNLTAEENKMLDRFERDLDFFLASFSTSPHEPEEEELFWEFDDEAQPPALAGKETTR